MILILVNPRLFRWAREHSGIVQEDLAGRFNVQRVAGMDGRDAADPKAGEAFARTVDVPVGYLLERERRKLKMR